MAMKKWKHKELHEPVQVRLPKNYLIPASDSEHDIAVEAAQRETFRKVNLLFDEYEIADHNWMRLAFLLAKDFVPGVRMIAATSGRPKVWNALTLAELKIAIDEQISQHSGWQITDAARIIAKNSPWKERVAKSKNPAELLRRNYYQADQRWVNVLKKGMAWEESQVRSVRKDRKE